MQGLLADVNVQGHLAYLRHRLQALGLWPVLAACDISFATLAQLQFAPNIDDRSLWKRCQQDGWVLFTENRNNAGPDSLQATLIDSWLDGQLPVLTLANKVAFEHDRDYADRVAVDVAELLFGINLGQYCDQPRIYVPR